MSLLRRSILLLLGIVGASISAQAAEWPPLPKQGFIVGRTATQADVNAGNAVFVAASGGKPIGKPLKLAIPQYAYFREGNKKTPVIVIQAEEAQGKRIVGARLAGGGEVVGLITDFELLGDVPPKK